MQDSTSGDPSRDDPSRDDPTRDDPTGTASSESADDFAPWPSPLYRDLVEELVRLRRRKTDLHRDAILDSSAFSVLLLLSDGRPRTLRELTTELELEQSTVNRQVNAAIRHGYLERFRVDGDLSGRIRATDRGREAFAHDGMLRVRRLERVITDLAPGTPESLLRELRAFNDSYDRAVRDEVR